MACPRLIWSDDFDTYANDAELEAAYPYQFDQNISSVSTSVNLVTPGPTGIPQGVDTRRVNLDFGGSFGVSQWLIAPTSRCFTVRGVWQNDWVDTINPAGTLFTLQQMVPDGSDVVGMFWSLTITASDNTAMQLFVSDDGGGISGYSSGYVTGLFTRNAANDVRVEGFISSVTNGVPNADGSVLVFVNDVQVLSHTGIVWSSGTNPVWNDVRVFPSGTFGALRVWDEPGDPDNPTDICPCVPNNPDTPPGVPNDPTPPSPGPIIPPLPPDLCGGLGLVPTQADIVAPELWWNL